MRRLLQSPLTDSNRRPLLTMGSNRQLVATRGNGFGLFWRLISRSHLPPIATGCNHGAPSFVVDIGNEELLRAVADMCMDRPSTAGRWHNEGSTPLLHRALAALWLRLAVSYLITANESLKPGVDRGEAGSRR